jgi:hypothetical protein
MQSSKQSTSKKQSTNNKNQSAKLKTKIKNAMRGYKGAHN